MEGGWWMTCRSMQEEWESAEGQRRAAEAKGMWLRNSGTHVRSQSRLLYGLLHEIDKQVESSERTHRGSATVKGPSPSSGGSSNDLCLS